MKRTQEPDTARRFWLWIGKPGSFHVNGTPSEILVDGWHTCSKDTRRGDLALRWITHPSKEIAYLLQAKSDAYDLSGNARARTMGWRYGCDFRRAHMFRVPLNLLDIRKDPYLEDWTALRARFQGTSFEIAADKWRRLNHHLGARNPTYKKILSRAQNGLSKAVLLEEQLEDRAASNPSILKRHGFDLDLYCTNGVAGRQIVCRGQGGRIDLLCYEKTKRRYVVNELKNIMATRETFGQVFSYVGWVKKHIANREKVIRLVISRGCDLAFRDCMSAAHNIQQVDLSALGFR